MGTSDQHSALIMEQVYLPLINQGIKLVLTDLITSELIKYASNSFLAAKIAFINEMADLCEIVGADDRGQRNLIDICSKAVLVNRDDAAILADFDAVHGAWRAAVHVDLANGIVGRQLCRLRKIEL